MFLYRVNHCHATRCRNYMLEIPQANSDNTKYGKKDEEIAEALFISSHTVKNHRKNVFRKLSIHSMAEFMRYANEKNLFKSE